jgi:hypothetical protein
VGRISALPETELPDWVNTNLSVKSPRAPCGAPGETDPPPDQVPPRLSPATLVVVVDDAGAAGALGEVGPPPHPARQADRLMPDTTARQRR